jgi:hypothetical protein
LPDDNFIRRSSFRNIPGLNLELEHFFVEMFELPRGGHVKKTSLHFLWKDRRAPHPYPTAVSLHGHTQHSWENLRFLQAFKLPLPLIPAVLRVAGWQHRRATGREMALARVLWTPPLAPDEAYRVEARQIANLGLQPIVSLTDHDDIESGLALRRTPVAPAAPVSFEWTVPFGQTFFHLGVHNLPALHARAIFAALHDYTAHPEARRLAELFDMLHAYEDLLVVLNHPLWDEADIGAAEHRRTLDRLLSGYGSWIHAIELNGLRSWAENNEALDLARAWQLPAISGGDRHGLEPNANLNLTQADNFGGFVAEIRRERLSSVLFMPQYRETLGLRWFETVKDIVRCHPGTQRPRWVDRFFYECEDGVTRPIAELWPNEGPALLRSVFAMLRLSESQSLRAALRWTVPDPVGQVAKLQADC